MNYLDTIKEKKAALQDKDQLTRSMQELVRLLTVSQTANRTLTLPDATDTLVGRDTTDTLTNKTLTTPTIASFINASHNHTNAAGGGQLTDAALSSAVTVSKGGTGNTTLTIGNVLVGAGTGAVTTSKAAPSGAFVGTTDTQTLTNKTLTTPVIDQFGTASGLGAGWSSYTPTLSGRFNDTKWTKNCKFKQVGKIVTVKIGLTANAATPMDGGIADCFITLPVTAAALTQTGNIQVMGMFNAFQGNLYVGHFGLASTTTAILRTQAVSGSNIIQQQITSTVPATWASGSEFGGTFTYEAA